MANRLATQAYMMLIQLSKTKHFSLLHPNPSQYDKKIISSSNHHFSSYHNPIILLTITFLTTKKNFKSLMFGAIVEVILNGYYGKSPFGVYL